MAHLDVLRDVLLEVLVKVPGAVQLRTFGSQVPVGISSAAAAGSARLLEFVESRPLP